jgi:hypothetical protein
MKAVRVAVVSRTRFEHAMGGENDCFAQVLTLLSLISQARSEYCFAPARKWACVAFPRAVAGVELRAAGAGVCPDCPDPVTVVPVSLYCSAFTHALE